MKNEKEVKEPKVRPAKPEKALKIKKEKEPSVKRNVAPVWYSLDNAAKIYPATRNNDWNATFRVAITLNEDVNPILLRQALEDLRPRFPTFFVQLRSGFYWYYFEPAISSDVVEEEFTYPCRPMTIGDRDKPLFRVIYYKKRISLEIFHAICDGFGALTFLKTLVGHYLELSGVDISDANGIILNSKDDPNSLEMEDSFLKYYKKNIESSRKEPKAYNLNVTKEQKKDYLRVISGSFSIEQIKKITHERDVTITQLLTSLYILAIFNDMPVERSQKPIRISVPVNLRKFFKTSTLRNFSLYVNVGVVPNDNLTLDEILPQVKTQLTAGLKKEVLQSRFSTNVASEKNIALRLAPLFIKNYALKIANSLVGTSLFTSAFSNFGSVEFPPSMREHIHDVNFILGVSPTSGMNMAAISLDDQMKVTFSSLSGVSNIQAFFFRYLQDLGVDVEVESNV